MQRPHARARSLEVSVHGLASDGHRRLVGVREPWTRAGDFVVLGIVGFATLSVCNYRNIYARLTPLVLISCMDLECTDVINKIHQVVLYTILIMQEVTVFLAAFDFCVRLGVSGTGFEPGAHTPSTRVRNKRQNTLHDEAVSAPRHAAHEPTVSKKKEVLARDREKKQKLPGRGGSLLRRRRRRRRRGRGRPGPRARDMSLGPRLGDAPHDRLASQPTDVDVHEHDVAHRARGQRRILARRSAVLVRDGGGDRYAARVRESHGRRGQRGEDDRRGERDARARSERSWRWRWGWPWRLLRLGLRERRWGG